MDSTPPSDRKPTTSTAASLPEERRSIAKEAKMIAKARASAAAGRVVSAACVDAWIDSLDTKHELPMPQSGG